MMRILVHESFDDLRARDMRFLQEAARLGDVHVLLLSDDAVLQTTGRPPKFRQEERLYLVESLRYVKSAEVTGNPAPPSRGFDLLAVRQRSDTSGGKTAAQSTGLPVRIFTESALDGFPLPEPAAAPRGTPKVVVTGCFDWFHSGHVRLFEEVSGLGSLYVVVGSDRNLRLLKGQGHPLFPQEERRYQAASVRHVTQALVSSGDGWLDAEPEIRALKPDMYAVNSDGDKPEKRELCERMGIRYVVLARTPREGLPARTSTNLRGF